MQKKILVTGGSGLLGSNLSKVISDIFDVHVIAHRHSIPCGNFQVHQLDITNREILINLVNNIKPDYIIHTAALTNVDYCEVNKEEAWQINVEATRNFVKAASITNSKLIYISTDSVFDGKTGMYTEVDEVNPLNYYAFTKLEGEKVVRTLSNSFVIIRTNIYGWNTQRKLSLAEWMLNSLTQKNKTQLFSDVFFTPILVNNLSQVISEIITKEISGLFNIAGSERVSKLEFGYELAKVFSLDSKLIEPTKVSEKKFVAKRPLDTSLCCKKISKEVATELLTMRDGLEAFKALLDKGYVEHLKRCLAI